MKLEISSFADPGDHQKERLVIKVLADLDIGAYAVFRSSLGSDGNPTSGRSTAYWFPDDAVKSGDLAVLYTKSGQGGKKDIGGGRTAHFYYWGLDNATWGTSGNTAVILRVAEWIHAAPQVSK
jgi:hypothetical protein